MGESRELTVDEANDIYNAIESVAQLDLLDGEVAYRLSRLQARVHSMVKAYSNVRSKIINRFKDLIDKAKTDDEKVTLAKQRDDKIKKLKDVTEKIKIPEFKLSSFIADKEIKLRDGLSIAIGQMLAPQYFFNKMSKYIIDDKTKEGFGPEVDDMESKFELVADLEDETILVTEMNENGSART